MRSGKMIWTLSLLLAVMSCKTAAPQAQVAGIGTDLDNPEGKLYLYTVEAGRLLRQYKCPAARPVVKANCEILGRTIVLESFEKELRDAINRDVIKSSGLIENYNQAYAALIRKAGENPAEAADLRAQAERIAGERVKEEALLVGFNAELASLDNTLAKLKDQDVEYEMNKGDTLYKDNRPTVSRFYPLLSVSKRYIDKGYGGTADHMYDLLAEAHDRVRKNCPADISCSKWITSLSEQMDFMVILFPKTDSDWDYLEFGPEIAAMSKKLASAYCVAEVSGRMTDAFVANANRLKAKILDPLQKRSPSLGGKTNACERRVVYE